MPQSDSSIVGLPDVEVLQIDGVQTVQIRARYVGVVSCPWCHGVQLRRKDKPSIRLDWAARPQLLEAPDVNPGRTRIAGLYNKTGRMS